MSLNTMNYLSIFNSDLDSIDRSNPILFNLGTYRIYDSVNNKSYIGCSMVKGFHHRLFSGKTSHYSGITSPSDKSMDWHFILHELPLSSIIFEILALGVDLEYEMIQEFDSFYNGYNKSLNGKYGNSGHYLITDGNINLSLKPEECENYISIHPEFHYGVTRPYSSLIGDLTRGKLRVTDGKYNYWMSNEEFESLNDPNLRIGMSKESNGCKGKIWVTNGLNTFRINPSDIDKYPGFRRGRSNL